MGGRIIVFLLLLCSKMESKELTVFPSIQSIINERHRNGITQSQFLQHESIRKKTKGLLSSSSDDEELKLHLFCTSSARDENIPLYKKRQHLKSSLGVSLEIMTIDKKQEIACYSGSVAKSTLSSHSHILEQYNFLAQSVPIEMKVHNSVISFIEENDVSKAINKEIQLEIIFYRPSDLPKSQVEEDTLKASHAGVLQSSWQSIRSDMDRSDFGSVGGKWGELREKYSNHACQSMPILNKAGLEQMRDTIKISLYNSFEKLHKDCFMRLIEAIADRPEVGKIEMASKVKALNFESRGLTQTGTMLEEPYSAAGLDGTGQVVGIADSGLSDLSCYFFDGNLTSGKSLVIERNLIDSSYGIAANMAVHGVVDTLRRKVINYNYNVNTDKVDEIYGHGTHVAGSVLGNCPGSPSTRGMSPGAKTSFFDIGNSDPSFGGFLSVAPSMGAIFDAAYYSGARIHTNSWGTANYYYTSLDQSVDGYLYDNPDMLILFAAGNDGNYGTTTVGSPAVAKNCITVGAMTVKQGDGDNFPISESTVADFSSLGPVDDNRYGIDVVAPGDPIFSAYSGPTSVQNEAVENNVGGMQERAVAEMSGTSMATPIVAGVATQMRQFLTSESFWKKICNPHDEYCIKFDFPRGALLKSMIIHSAEPVARYRRPADDNSYYPNQLPSQYLGTPPDNFQGYGAVRMSNVIPLNNGEGLNPDKSLFLWENLVIEDDEVHAFTVNIPQINANKNLDIKVTIAWYDPPLASTSVGAVALINDVDLIVKSPNGILYPGNQQEDGDSLNPVEQVHITNVIAGDYTIYLVGYFFDHGKQDISITMTYPSHTYPESKQHKYVNGPTKLSHSQLESEIDNLQWMSSSPAPEPVTSSVPLPARSPTPRPNTWEDYELSFPSGTKIGPVFNELVPIGSFDMTGHMEEVQINLYAAGSLYGEYSSLSSVFIMSPEGKLLQAGGHSEDTILYDSGVYRTEPWMKGCCTTSGRVPVGGADMFSTPTNATWHIYLAFTPGWDASTYYDGQLSLSEKTISGSVVFTFDTNHGTPTMGPTLVPPLEGIQPTNFTYCSLPTHQRITFYRASIDYSLQGRNGSLTLTGLEPMFYPRVRLLKLTMVYNNPDGTGKINHHATKIFIAASEPTRIDEFHANFEIIEDAWNNHPTSIRLKFMGDRMIGPPQPDGNGNLVWPDGTIADVGTKKVPSHNHLLGCFYFDPSDV